MDGFGLLDAALGGQAVEDVPVKLGAGVPAVDLAGQIVGVAGVVGLVTGEQLHGGFVPGLGGDNVLLAEFLGLAQGLDFGAPVPSLGDGRRKLDLVGIVLEGVGEVDGNVLQHGGRKVHAQKIDEGVFGDAPGVAGGAQFGAGVGQLHLGPQHVEPGDRAGLKTPFHVVKLAG